MKKKMIAMVVAGVSLVGAAGGILAFSGAGQKSIALAEQVKADTSAPQRIETIVYDSWTVTCRDMADKKKNCTAILRVVDDKNNNVILIWAIGKDLSDKLTAVLQTPTGVQIAAGVSLKIDNGAEHKLSYATCSPRQCDATAPINASFQKEISAGAEATAVITLIDGRAAEFKFPLKGSAAALKQVTGN